MFKPYNKSNKKTRERNNNTRATTPRDTYLTWRCYACVRGQEDALDLTSWIPTLNVFNNYATVTSVDQAKSQRHLWGD